MREICSKCARCLHNCKFTGTEPILKLWERRFFLTVKPSHKPAPMLSLYKVVIVERPVMHDIGVFFVFTTLCRIEERAAMAWTASVKSRGLMLWNHLGCSRLSLCFSSVRMVHLSGGRNADEKGEEEQCAHQGHWQGHIYGFTSLVFPAPHLKLEGVVNFTYLIGSTGMCVWVVDDHRVVSPHAKSWRVWSSSP